MERGLQSNLPLFLRAASPLLFVLLYAPRSVRTVASAVVPTSLPHTVRAELVGFSLRLRLYEPLPPECCVLDYVMARDLSHYVITRDLCIM